MPLLALARRAAPLALRALLATAAACASATAPSHTVTAVARTDGLEIANHGDVSTCYFAISRNALAYTDFVLTACDPARTTEAIAPGASVTRPWSSFGAASDTEYLVWWWTGALPAPGDWRGTGHSGQLTVTR